MSCTVPTGTCQAMLRVFRSIALSVPNGGAWQGMPSADRKRFLLTAYGVPFSGTAPMPVLTASPPLEAAAFSAFCGIICTHRPRRMSLANTTSCTGSTDSPPQFMPPSEPGKLSDTSVPGAVYRPS